MAIINDIIEQIENTTATDDTDDENENNMQESSLLSEKQGESSTLEIEGETFALDDNQFKNNSDANKEVENAKNDNGLELQGIESIKEKVIPLYAPDDAVVKVFMVHGSQKSALVLGTYALGFQQQVIIYSLK